MSEWRFAEKPIGETTVKKIEKALDIKFPNDYITTILNNNGARPSKKIFDFENTKGAVFNRLHGLTEDSSSFILEIFEDYQDGRMLSGIVLSPVILSVTKSVSIIVRIKRIPPWYSGIMKLHMKILMEL